MPAPVDTRRKKVPREDAHYFVVNGRRWHKTDPQIPEKLRKELVKELMAARREKDRPRVQDAKVALGERGEKWWEPASEAGTHQRLQASMRALLRARLPTSSICPSDVARIVGGAQWRSLLPQARTVAREAARAGEVVITQGHRPLDPDVEWQGPIRIRRKGIAAMS